MSEAFAVVVVAGGPSSEAAVSRASASGVEQALAAAGHRPRVVELDRALPAALAGDVDVVFPATHGSLGEDGCLQGLLEVLDLPYVGSGVLASALAASKPHAKVQFARAGLPLAEERLVLRGEDPRARAASLRAELGPALFVKPASGGSAIGVGRVRADDDESVLVAALEAALEADPVALVERFVEGLEITCSVLDDEAGEPRALPPTLILSRANEWYDFRSKYADGGSEHRCPAPLEASLAGRVQEMSVAAHKALGARDLSRVDFVIAEGGKQPITLLELNTLPGMTATSLFPEAAAAAGIPFPALCDRLVRRAHARPRRKAPGEMPMP